MSAKRSMKHPKPTVEFRTGKEALRAEQAKELLGWEEEPEGETWGKDDYLFVDRNGKKVRCVNNTNNRPFYLKTICLPLMQEILRKRWRFNMETRIIGKTGLCLSCQHTFAALVFAGQEWYKDKDSFPQWKQEPRIDVLLALGADESDETVNTLDTARGRTLSDVIYRTDYFPSCPAKQRKKLADMLRYAVQFLWDRTGVSDAYSIFRTHSESLAFIERHPKLLECVQHIWGEDVKKLKGIITPGYASGLLYLMGCSQSSGQTYQEAEEATEDSLNWNAWDKACAFWVELLGGNIPAVRKVLSRLTDEEGLSLRTQVAVVIEAWTLYSEGLKVTVSDISPEYETDSETGIRRLATHPTIAGIDRGVDREEQLSPEEVKERAKKERVKKEASEKPKKPAKKKSAKKKSAKASEASQDAPSKPRKAPKKKAGAKHPLTGRTLWVSPEGSEPYEGRVIKVIDKTAHLKISQGHQGAGSIRKIPVKDLRAQQPDHRTSPTEE